MEKGDGGLGNAVRTDPIVSGFKLDGGALLYSWLVAYFALSP